MPQSKQHQIYQLQPEQQYRQLKRKVEDEIMLLEQKLSRNNQIHCQRVSGCLHEDSYCWYRGGCKYAQVDGEDASIHHQYKGNRHYCLHSHLSHTNHYHHIHHCCPSPQCIHYHSQLIHNKLYNQHNSYYLHDNHISNCNTYNCSNNFAGNRDDDQEIETNSHGNKLDTNDCFREVKQFQVKKDLINPKTISNQISTSPRTLSHTNALNNYQDINQQLIQHNLQLQRVYIRSIQHQHSLSSKIRLLSEKLSHLEVQNSNHSNENNNVNNKNNVVIVDDDANCQYMVPRRNKLQNQRLRFDSDDTGVRMHGISNSKGKPKKSLQNNLIKFPFKYQTINHPSHSKSKSRSKSHIHNKINNNLNNNTNRIKSTQNDVHSQYMIAKVNSQAKLNFRNSRNQNNKLMISNQLMRPKFSKFKTNHHDYFPSYCYFHNFCPIHKKLSSKSPQVYKDSDYRNRKQQLDHVIQCLKQMSRKKLNQKVSTKNNGLHNPIVKQRNNK